LADKLICEELNQTSLESDNMAKPCVCPNTCRT